MNDRNALRQEALVERTATLRFAAAIVLAAAATAGATLYGWPPNKRPPLPFRTALEKAEAVKPEGAFCTGVSIFADREGRTGSWSFHYDTTGERAAFVSVEMNGAAWAREHMRYRPATAPATTRTAEPAATRPARGAAARAARATAEWPVGVPPPLTLDDAFSKAFARVGDALQVRFCTGAWLRATEAQDGKAGAWRFFWYDSERRASFVVDVDMDGRVHVER